MSATRSQLRHSTPTSISAIAVFTPRPRGEADFVSGRRNTATVVKIGVAGRPKPIVSSDYIVGLTDGEGCFYVLVKASPQYRAGAAVQLHFHIKLQEADRIVLEKVRTALKCGAVYFQNEKRRNHAQCYRYTVASNKDVIEKIIPFFRKYPLQSASKRKNFEIFCRIANIVQEKQHLTSEGLKEIQALKQQMNQRTIGLA